MTRDVDADEPAPDHAYKVLGHQTDGSGTTYGVEGRVDSPDGFGLYTPDDARVEGTVDTGGTAFVVEAGTTAGSGARNVVVGHASNSATSGTVGVTIGGGGYDDGSTDQSHTVHDSYGTIGGGAENVAGSSGSTNGNLATVGGGQANRARAVWSTIAGGWSNIASGERSSVGGGSNNGVTDKYARIGGGASNSADGYASTVAGGLSNFASADRATVGGGESNEVAASYGTVAGGGSSDAGGGNLVTDDHGAVGGGKSNRAGTPQGATSGATHATVSGGVGNAASAPDATVGGGRDNVATSGSGATIAGGTSNAVTAAQGTVAGGDRNAVGGEHATVGGGAGNEAHGDHGTVAGGGRTSAPDPSTGNEVHADYGSIGGGGNNRVGASGSTTGTYATVGGGRGNVAAGQYATVPGGRNGEAREDGTFVWADSTDETFASDQAGTGASPTGPDTFHVRATGGVRFVTEQDLSGTPTAGQYLSAGGSSWQTVSARAAKQRVEPVDPPAVLEKVEDLDVSTWEYESNEGVRRMGPMAGAFHEAFGLGDDPETIGHVDADGVALAAIQGLSRKLDDRDERIETLADRVDEKTDRVEALERENDELRARVAALEATVDSASGSGAEAVDDGPGAAGDRATRGRRP